MGVVAPVSALGTEADITLAVTAAALVVELDAAVDEVVPNDDNAAAGVFFVVAEVVEECWLEMSVVASVVKAPVDWVVNEPPLAGVAPLADEVDVDPVAGVLGLSDAAEELPVVAAVLLEVAPLAPGVLAPPEVPAFPEADPLVDVDFVDAPDNELVADDVVVPVVAEVIVDVEDDDADAAGVFAVAPVVEVEPVDDEDEAADEVVDDFVPVVSASATAGVLATAVPIPSAIASAPTRPMYLQSGPVATATESLSDSARTDMAAWRPLVFLGALSRAIEAVMSPPLPTSGFSPAV